MPSHLGTTSNTFIGASIPVSKYRAVSEGTSGSRNRHDIKLLEQKMLIKRKVYKSAVYVHLNVIFQLMLVKHFSPKC